ncbi:putative sugar nucleotidyl transferase [Blattabacterium cuenoti]|uniref:putative sugar nucleotidyl transferase n=1 Tax=Blattabacterium cuenoti TaxID=1653831 RepID=UPI001EEB33CD|nr:putative sugar nucleotidyl transferase [Blattabacterium cuenoti]
MNIILYDDIIVWNNLLPLTLTRSISEIRSGIFTLKKRWENYFEKNINYIFTKSFLLEKYLLKKENLIFKNVLLINSSFIPNKEIFNIIYCMNNNEIIFFKKEIVAIKKEYFSYKDYDNKNFLYELKKNCKKVYLIKEIIRIKYLWDIIKYNIFLLKKDFSFLTKGKKSNILLGKNIIINKDNIFLEEDLKTNNVVLNANFGPIYIKKKVDIMEGTVIRGPVFIGNNSVLNIGSKIYGGTSINSFCKVGGEIINSILFSYSNKSHEGFMGDTVLGEWCNLGSGTNISNLRNDYSKVTIWNYCKNKFISTKIQFLGMIMGDHSKSSINTQFNTSTVVGVGANIFGYGFPPRFIPSFSLGGIQNNRKIPFEKVCKTAKIVMKRRNKQFSIIEKNILEYIYKLS